MCPIRLRWTVIGLACAAVCLNDAQAGQPTLEPGSAPEILIVPANYDPADEGGYTRNRGEVAPGHRADGPVWNAPRTALAAQAAPPRSAPEDDAPPQPGDGSDGPRPGAEAASMPMLPPFPLMSYADAYSTVPFSRTEYEANPSYRHDTAVELMFGQMRPTTIMRQLEPHVLRYPEFYRFPFSRYPNYFRFDTRQRRSGSPYGYGSPYYGY